MIVGKDGAVISKATAGQISSLGKDYVCMWDDSGLPIHIHKDVIDYLYNGIHAKPPTTSTPTQNPSNGKNSPFLEG